VVARVKAAVATAAAHRTAVLAARKRFAAEKEPFPGELVVRMINVRNVQTTLAWDRRLALRLLSPSVRSARHALSVGFAASADGGS
jgi:hypothetical protein